MPSAQRILWAKTRSAITIAVALSILGVTFYLLFGGNPFRPNVELRTLVTDSGGMPIGSPVRLNGIRIGEVSAITLAENPRPDRHVEVRMTVERSAVPHIPNDSIVEIGADSLLGDKLIDITAGRSDQPVQPGGELEYQPPVEIDRAQVIASLERNLRLIDRLLDDIEAGRGSLSRLLRDEQIYTQTNARLGQLERAVRNARTAGTLGRLIRDDADYRRFQETVARLDARLADVEAGRGAAGEMLFSSRRYQEWRDGVAALRRQIDAAKKNRFVAGGQDYAAWNRMVEKFIRDVEAINAGEGSLGSLLLAAQTYESFMGASANLEAFLQDLRKNPGKFLRLNLDLF
jgi:phospholipid/cholesterol/gamma-HCH transport system substrate-binding protein